MQNEKVEFHEVLRRDQHRYHDKEEQKENNQEENGVRGGL